MTQRMRILGKLLTMTDVTISFTAETVGISCGLHPKILTENLNMK